MLYCLYKAACLQQTLVSTSIQPGKTASKKLYIQITTFQVCLINTSYFQLAPMRRPYLLCDIDYVVIVK